jgi:3'(2'), 5'-bisphosphate nucleotidase
MDSQAKYCALARGDGGVYLRVPSDPSYVENILVEEAGGTVTDSKGERLNFGLGRTLGANHGVVAAGKEAHSLVLNAIVKLNHEQRAKA